MMQWFLNYYKGTEEDLREPHHINFPIYIFFLPRHQEGEVKENNETHERR